MSINTKPISRNSSKESNTSNSPPRIKNKIMDINPPTSHCVNK